MSIVLSLLVGYLVGSIPFAFLLARRARGVDLRTAGSGNVGATNVMRTAGIPAAIAVLALDAAKGAAVVLLADWTGARFLAREVAGVAAVVGHVYPAWLGFRGGKGVATAFGVFGALAPAAAGACFGMFLLTVWITRYVSLGSLMATAALAPMVYLTHGPAPVIVAAIVTATIVVERHRGNLTRLQAGTERRLGQRV